MRNLLCYGYLVGSELNPVSFSKTICVPIQIEQCVQIVLGMSHNKDRLKLSYHLIITIIPKIIIIKAYPRRDPYIFLRHCFRIGNACLPEKNPVVIYCEHGPRADLAGISLYFNISKRCTPLRDTCKGGGRMGYRLKSDL